MNDGALNFRSDNVASVAPAIMAAIDRANRRSEGAYGHDEITAGLERLFGDLFETEVKVFPTLTGTAANGLALSALTPGHGAVLCHADAHINKEECGAPEFFTGGAKLVPLAGARGKIGLDALEAALARGGQGDVHYAQLSVLSLTQQTEEGTVYSLDEVRALTECARRHRLGVHMDGARFANAVAALGCSPAEASWRAGIDVLSFGATKNGAMAAEAVIFFRPELAQAFAYRHKRAGQLLSKMRFVAAQLAASVEGGLWLALARHANTMARRLGQGLAALPGVSLAGPVDGNEVFVILPETAIGALEARGAGFYRWPEAERASRTVRLVTAHDTTPEMVEAFIAAARTAVA